MPTGFQGLVPAVQLSVRHFEAAHGFSATIHLL